MKPYIRLRAAMMENDVNQSFLARRLLCGTDYVGRCINGRQSWRMEEVYQICDLLHIPYNEIPAYFPKGGFL